MCHSIRQFFIFLSIHYNSRSRTPLDLKIVINKWNSQISSIIFFFSNNYNTTPRHLKAMWMILLVFFIPSFATERVCGKVLKSSTYTLPCRRSLCAIVRVDREQECAKTEKEKKQLWNPMQSLIFLNALKEWTNVESSHDETENHDIHL